MKSLQHTAKHPFKGLRGAGSLVVALALLLFAGTTTDIVAQNGKSLVQKGLPYGLSWNDNDSTSKVKLAANEGLTLDEPIVENGMKVVRVKGATYDRFNVADLVLIYDTNNTVAAASWRFDRTRILTTVGIFDFLYPSFRDRLGNPDATPDSTRQFVRTYNGLSDREIFKNLKEGTHDLYAQWKVKVNREAYVVDLRVDNESRQTVLTIAKASILAPKKNDKKAESVVEQQDEEIDTKQKQDEAGMSVDASEEVASADGAPLSAGTVSR